MSITRRAFLHRVARAGGAAAMFSAMQALGLAPAAEASTLPDLPADFGKGRKVVVVGGGIAGLVTAYELRKAGFAPIVLEAAKRPGGRNWSARNGTRVEFTDGIVQDCSWDEGHYMNMGPARIPSIHRNLLGYCEELGVALEVEINTSRSTFMQADVLNGGKPVEQRRVIHDTRGYIAELLSKAIDRHTLDDVLTAQDRERLRAFLKGFGDLSEGNIYTGTERGGFAVARGAGPVQEKYHKPLSLSELLAADLSKGEFYEEHIDWQATMFQPVGGMDRIPYAFAKSLGEIVKYGAPVTEIRNTSKGVRVSYGENGATRTIDADFCVCAMPASILKDVKSNFAPATKAAATAIPMTSLYKVGWQAPRFWEKESNIYGGISFLKQPVDLVWYPSDRLFSKSGIVIAGFNLEYLPNGQPTEFGALASTEARIAASRMAVEKLHPGHGKDLTKPIYISWARVPYIQGATAMTTLPEMLGYYTQLNKADGQVWFAGDWLSRIVGWQEGAILSAHRAVAGIAERVRAEGLKAA
ncbi:amino acid oxidase [Sphingomonas oleivorans]|uniref:Tryptophan 2-monooxygenase n=1 Tax=Sphingomonas oleivorans TaxID=1735121 RepID=A0A2T5G011_9SPHN|nr:FAD-dependent oxidoreductase [Sphingomonas oleivorans]PTQ12278.1 amino acid oxidase [Sphingomonas oleivorans]